jgi:ketosteroid isomerase-like protein
MASHGSPPLLLLLGGLGCATASPAPSHGSAEADRSALLAEDARFDAAVAAHGVDAWIAEFASDTAIWDGAKLVHDRELYRTKMGPLLSKPGNALRWQPEWAEAQGDLGYTTGKWQLHALGADGQDQVKATGKYVTVWRRQPDGTWKVVFDMGNDDR